MSYIDVIKIKDTIHVVERRNGKRVFQKFPAKYIFYAKTPKGQFTSIYGDPLYKFESNSYSHFQQERRNVRDGALFEHDINPIFRHLEEHYSGAETPELHIAFFDIEVDFDPARGFASPWDPYCPVNAVSVYQNWTGKNITYALKPKTLTWDEAVAICDKFEDTELCKDEKEFYEKFFDAIEDADVLSGWNSTTFDIPYMVQRLERIKNKDATKRFCLWNQYPTKKIFERYGKEQLSYELHGRVHLDYLELYQKHTYHEMHSYRLDFVADYEVGETKVAYEGSLDKLYNYDFEKFLDYNRQDTILLVKIDAGKNGKLIELSNQMAHDNTVLLQTTLGSVALIEQAIINEIHAKDLVAPSKKRVLDDNTSIAGAYVATPVKGMHDWVGSVDINSLYPSVIRSLNISPEAIIGQMRLEKTMQIINKHLKDHKTSTTSDAWADFFEVIEYTRTKNRTDDLITVDLEDGSVVTQPGSDWHDLIFNDESNICLSANGTLFRKDIKGIIPGLLERWYSERVAIQKEASDMYDELKKLENSPAVDQYDKDGNYIDNGTMTMVEREEKIEELKLGIGFRDKRQLIKKILLNSLYGALLNPHCRFFDQRMGQSVTLTGRCITKHMIAKMNEIFTGDYDHLGICSLYGDTDSSYFSAYPAFKGTGFDWTKENVLELYDTASEQMNGTFPKFMVDSFNTSLENGQIIQAGREVCAIKGLFIKKKRYALLCYDIEGRRFDVDGKPGKIKAMGVDLKRSDTPKVIQDFLEVVLTRTLSGSTEEEIMDYVRNFRLNFRKWEGWQKGTPKRVNGLTKKVELEAKLGKITMAGHQRASKNWNTLRKIYEDNYSMEIQDGAKVVVCKLLNNPLRMTSIAYPVDQEHLPEWFKDLPFDHDGMEETLIDNKLENLVGVLKWRIRRPEEDTTFGSFFTSN